MGTLTVPELTHRLPQGPSCARRPSLVIVDDGHRAMLVRLPDEADPRIGLRLQHAGRWWQIRDRRAHARAWVARPVAHADAC